MVEGLEVVREAAMGAVTGGDLAGGSAEVKGEGLVAATAVVVREGAVAMAGLEGSSAGESWGAG